MTASFRGKRYEIIWEKLGREKSLAQCDEPTAPQKEIRLDPRQFGQNLLDSLVHESLHACLWDLREEAVIEISSDIARFLWRMGCRITDSDTSK